MMILAVSFWLFAAFNHNERAQIANGQKQIAKTPILCYANSFQPLIRIKSNLLFRKKSLRPEKFRNGRILRAGRFFLR